LKSEILPLQILRAESKYILLALSGDALAQHNLMAFSTQDRDNDKRPTASCAELYGGAWWYNDCHWVRHAVDPLFFMLQVIPLLVKSEWWIFEWSG
jgi:hypothetical protein